MDKRLFYRFVSKGFHALAGISLVSVLALSLMSTPAHGQLKSGGGPAIGTNLNETAGQAFDTGKGNLPRAIGGFIQVLLGLLGIVAIAIVLFAGFTWMTAGGESEKVDEAKTMMKNAIWGLAIIVLAYAITKFVIDLLISASNQA